MSEIMTFNPEIKDPNKETNERLLKYRDEIINYAHLLIDIDEGKRPESGKAKQGQKLAKMFVRCVEKSKDQEKAIELMTNLFKKVGLKYEIMSDVSSLIAGFKTEYASAFLLNSLSRVESVEYPSDEEDLKSATDFKINTPEGEQYNIQTKAVSLEMDREDLGEKALPILSKLETIDDLQAFLDHLKELANMFTIAENDPNKQSGSLSEMISGLGTRMEDIKKEISITLLPDKRVYKKDEQISELAYSAIRMHLLGQKNGFKPIMCVLGSPESSGSDINAPSAEPLRPVISQAESELANLLPLTNT